MILENLKTILELNNKVNYIVDLNLSWELKYNLIFSDEISSRVFELIDLDYYDPDSTYEADVLAFVDGFNLFTKEHKITSKLIHDIVN